MSYALALVIIAGYNLTILGACGYVVFCEDGSPLWFIAALACLATKIPRPKPVEQHRLKRDNADLR